MSATPQYVDVDTIGNTNSVCVCVCVKMTVHNILVTTLHTSHYFVIPVDKVFYVLDR